MQELLSRSSQALTPCVVGFMQVKNFTAGLELFKRIADVAEAEKHHPDLHLEGWNNVSAVLNTHSVGALLYSPAHC